MSDEIPNDVQALGAAADAALALTERRLRVEEAQRVNDAALQRLVSQHGIGLDAAAPLHVRFVVLVDQLLGTMDAEARLTYEEAVQAKFMQLIAEAEQQAARARLLNGVRLDPRQQQPPTAR